MNKTIAGCLAAALLLTSGCAQMAARRAAAEQAAQAQFAQEVAVIDAMTPEQRHQYQAQLYQQLARDQYAREFCANQGTMAGVSVGLNGNIFGPMIADVGMHSSCLDFYQRTGHLPGQAY